MRIVEALNRFFQADVSHCADKDLECIYRHLLFREKCDFLHAVGMAIADALYGKGAKALLEFCSTHADILIVRQVDHETYKLLRGIVLRLDDKLADLEKQYFAD